MIYKCNITEKYKSSSYDNKCVRESKSILGRFTVHYVISIWGGLFVPYCLSCHVILVSSGHSINIVNLPAFTLLSAPTVVNGKTHTENNSRIRPLFFAQFGADPVKCWAPSSKAKQCWKPLTPHRIKLDKLGDLCLIKRVPTSERNKQHKELKAKPPNKTYTSF